LLLAFKTAAMDLSDVPLRRLLERALESLMYPYGPWDYARQSESTTRRIICQYVLECLGTFRRDELLPAEPEAFKETLANVQLWIEWQEERDRLEEEDRASWRAKRAAEAAKNGKNFTQRKPATTSNGRFRNPPGGADMMRRRRYRGAGDGTDSEECRQGGSGSSGALLINNPRVP